MPVRVIIMIANVMTRDLINSYEDCIDQYSDTYPKCKTLEAQWRATWYDEFWVPPSILNRRIEDLKNTALKNN